jgi:hypothetical protein
MKYMMGEKNAVLHSLGLRKPTFNFEGFKVSKNHGDKKLHIF